MDFEVGSVADVDFPRLRMWLKVEFELRWNKFLLLVIIDCLMVVVRVEERIICRKPWGGGDSTEADILDGFEFAPIRFRY